MSDKTKITSSELGVLIARDVLAHIGQSPIMLGLLSPEDQKRFEVESEVAHLMFFAHLFVVSCTDPEFAGKTVKCLAEQIALRMSENEDLQRVLGLGKHISARQAYEELANVFFERGHFYLRILDTCREGDYGAFETAYNRSLALQQDVIDGLLCNRPEQWHTLAVGYRGMIDRIWETMVPSPSPM